MGKYSEYDEELDEEEYVPFWERAEEEEELDIDGWDKLDDVGDYDRVGEKIDDCWP